MSTLAQLPDSEQWRIRPHTTKYIVDENGHLLNGKKKPERTAFVASPAKSAPRWLVFLGS